MATIWKNIQLVHPPKTAGTAVAKILKQITKEQYEITRYKKGKRRSKHAPPHNWDKYTIGTIRNPLSTYVSLWAYGCIGKGGLKNKIKGEHNKYYDKHYLSDKDVFQQWLQTIFKTRGSILTKRLMRCTGRKPQNVDCWIYQEDLTNSLIKALKQAPKQLKLKKSWKSIIERKSKKKRNESKHHHWQFYYTPELIKKTKRREKFIFEMFDY